MAVIFKGFSSPVQGNTKTLYNEELVRQDLINQFSTKKGERAFNVDYGFIGWDLIFSLDNFNVKNLLEADCRRIVSEDPRVKLLNIRVIAIEYGYAIEIDLQYVILNSVETLKMVFDSRNADDMSSFIITS